MEGFGRDMGQYGGFGGGIWGDVGVPGGVWGAIEMWGGFRGDTEGQQRHTGGIRGDTKGRQRHVGKMGGHGGPGGSRRGHWGLTRGEEAVLLEELHDQSAALVQRAAQGRIGNLIVLQLPQNVVPIGT